MTLKQRVLTITFLESLGTVLVERGVYFYSAEFYGFGRVQNLLLALLFGLSYAAAALTSHPVSQRLGERRALRAFLWLHLPLYALLAARGPAWMLAAGMCLSGVLYGIKWPVVESFMVSGDTPSAALRTIGRFNVSWAAAVPVALIVTGPLLAWHDWALFAAAGAITLASIGLAAALPAQPTHLPDDHPERPASAAMESYRALLLAARWLMFSSYAMLWILAAVLPITFNRLGVSVSAASALSALIDFMRLSAFLIGQFYTGWHGQRWPLVGVMAALPTGFLMALCGHSLPTILAGEAIFGLAAGLCYYAALYYAMVEKNASVEAGGAHEGVIGLGFAAGPLAGAIGYTLGAAWGSEALGILAGVGPLVLVCLAGAARSLPRRRRDGSAPSIRRPPPEGAANPRGDNA